MKEGVLGGMSLERAKRVREGFGGGLPHFYPFPPISPESAHFEGSGTVTLRE